MWHSMILIWKIMGLFICFSLPLPSLILLTRIRNHRLFLFFYLLSSLFPPHSSSTALKMCYAGREHFVRVGVLGRLRGGVLVEIAEIGVDGVMGEKVKKREFTDVD